ncbi:MAG: bi-domain-containing oxidoreductase [Phycisphaerales bacterium]|nr:MAG: bi-domain-containing oxidoreductase [Phycisphaerales bacterium]
MKQILVGDRVCVADVPAPGMGSGQVLVEVAYSFISTGTEIAGVKGARGGVVAKIKEHPQRVAQVLEMVRVDGVKRTFARVKSRLDSRTAPGYSCAGRVIAVGKDVRNFAPGDFVACAGQGYACHAEIVAVPANLVARVPDGCDLRAASATTVGSIALQGVRQADLCLGELAAVLGLGLLGQLTLQLLSASGVDVLGLDPNPKRVDEAKALGFYKCFAVSGEQAVSEILSRTADMGADATLITAATDTPGICQDAMSMTRRKGRVVVVGAVPLQFERDPFYRKEIDFVISCSYGPGRYDPTYEEGGQDYPYAYVRWTENRNMQAVLKMIADGTLRIDPLIAGEYSAADADQAFASLASDEGPRPLALVLKYSSQTAEGSAKASTTVEVALPKPLAGQIGLGIIGVGQFCRSTHLPNVAAQTDKFQLVSVCDKQGAIAHDIARQYGASQACTDAGDLLRNDAVQLVLIATRHDLHAPLAMEALRAGKHVFTEKPMAMNEDQLKKLVELIQQGDRYFMVGFNRRFSPHAVALRELLVGRSGPLVVNYRVQGDPAPADSWIYSASGGGRVIGEACHMFDLFDLLVGDGIAAVEVDVVAPPAGVGGPVGDNLVASIQYEDGSLCTLIYSVLGKKSKQLGKERIEAMWQGRTFVIDDFVQCVGSGCSPSAVTRKSGKGHGEALAALGDYLLGRGPQPLSLEACINATRTSFRVDAMCRREPVET